MPPATIAPSRSGELTAADLTEADVEALAGFLAARLAEVKGRHGLETDEGKTGLVLRLVLASRLRDVRDTFTDDSPELLPARRRQWNRLVSLATPWRHYSHPDYDKVRWQDVHYADADDAARAAAFRRSRL